MNLKGGRMEIVRQIDDVDFGIMEKMNGDSVYGGVDKIWAI